MIKSLIQIICLTTFPILAAAYQCPFEEAYFKDIVFNRYENSNLVAKIKSRKIVRFALDDEYSSYNLVYADVLKPWKGQDTQEIIIKDVNSPISGYLDLKESKEYIIYGHGPDADGYYEIYTCDLETIGNVYRRQETILDEIKSNKLKTEKYYELFSRIERFVGSIEEINAKPSEDSIQVSITLQEDSPDWMSDSVVRFIKEEGKALGIKNMGKINTFHQDGQTTIYWAHPEN